MIRFFRIGCIAVSLFFMMSLANAQYITPTVGVDSSGYSINFAVARRLFDLYVMRDAELIKRLNEFLPLNSADSFILAEKEHMNDLHANFSLQTALSRWDILSVTLFAKEVNLIGSRFLSQVKIFEELNSAVGSTLMSRRKLMVQFRALDRKRLLPTEVLASQESAKMLESHVKVLTVYLNEISSCLDFLHASLPAVRDMMEVSDKHKSKLLTDDFFKRDTNFYREVCEKDLASESYNYYLKEFIRNQFPTIGRYLPKLLLSLLVLGVPFFFIGTFLFNQVIKRTRMHEQTNRSRTFIMGFGMLTCAVIIGLSKDGQSVIETIFLGRVSEWLFSFAVLIMALSIRLSKSERQVAIRLYLPIIFQNICAILLSSLLMPYRGLVIIVPVVNTAVLLWIVFVMYYRRKSLPVFDQVIGWVSMIATSVSIVTAAMGLAYLGYSVMLICFGIVTNILILVAVFHLCVSFMNNNPNRVFLNNGIRRLFLPLFSYHMAQQVFVSAAELFNIQESFFVSMSEPFVNNPELMVVSVNDVLLAIGGIFALNFILTIKRTLVQRMFGSAAAEGFIPSLMTLATYVAWLIYFLVVMMLFKVNYSAILVVLGALSMGLGFGLKDIVENFISGILLLVGQQLRPGDVVEFEGVMGKVSRVRIRDTLVETFEGAVLTIPNSQVLSKDFRNWTSNNTIRRDDLTVGVSYGTHIGKAKKIMMEAVAQTPFILSQPAPEIFVTQFGDSSVDLRLYYWMTLTQRMNVKSLLLENIYNGFNENGITIPFPQMDVHFDSPASIPSLEPVSPLQN